MPFNSRLQFVPIIHQAFHIKKNTGQVKTSEKQNELNHPLFMQASVRFVKAKKQCCLKPIKSAACVTYAVSHFLTFTFGTYGKIDF